MSFMLMSMVKSMRANRGSQGNRLRRRSHSESEWPGRRDLGGQRCRLLLAAVVVGIGVTLFGEVLAQTTTPDPTLVDPTAEVRAAVTATATAMHPQARASYDVGLRRYSELDFDGAIAAFEAGHAIDPRREFLFAEAQAFRLKGDCGRAVPLYRKFLAMQPPALQIQATQLGIDRCTRPNLPSTRANVSTPPTVSTGSSIVTGSSLRAPQTPHDLAPAPSPSPSATALPPPQSLAPSPTAAITLPQQRLEHVLRDPWSLAPLVGSAVALGTGIAFWISSHRALPPATPNPGATYAEFEGSFPRAEARRTIAFASLTLAGGLWLVGMARAWWLVNERHDDASHPSRRRSTIGFDGQRFALMGVY